MKKVAIVCLSLLSLFTIVFAQEAVKQEANQKNLVKADYPGKFDIVLISNKSTGYEWQIAQPLDNNFVALVGSGSKYQLRFPRMIGAGGTETWTFNTLKEGSTKITFKYVRQWEKNVAPAQTKEFVIEIKAKSGGQ